MKLPKAIHVLRKELFPTAEEQQAEANTRIEAFHASMAAEAAAKALQEEKAARDLKQKCVARLQPHIGRLILVTNFKGSNEQQNAGRIAQAVTEAGTFGEEAAIGTSVHLMFDRRTGPSHQTFMQTGQALAGAFEQNGYRTAQPNFVDVYTPEEWLGTIVSAVEKTVQGSKSAAYGHIAVVGALDIKRTGQADIPGYVDPGTAFMLTSVEDTHLGWQLVSAEPDSHYVQEIAMREEMKRFFGEE